MGRVGVPEAVRLEVLGEAEFVSIVPKAHPDVAGRDALSPLGHPQPWMLREAELRPDLLHVLRDHLNGPGHDREHAAPPGRASLHRLAVADRKDAEAAELGELRIYPEIGDV